MSLTGYCEASRKVPMTILSTDKFVTSALVCQGVIPCSQITPTVGIDVEVLELYRVTHLRSPHLSVQAFVKTLCDLQTVSVQMYKLMSFEINQCIYLTGSISEISLASVFNRV